MDQMFRIVGFHRHLTIKVGIRFIFLPELLQKQEKAVLKTSYIIKSTAISMYSLIILTYFILTILTTFSSRVPKCPF